MGLFGVVGFEVESGDHGCLMVSLLFSQGGLPVSRGENSGKRAPPCTSRFISAHTLTSNKATNTPTTIPTATKVQKGTGNVEPVDPGLEGFCFISHIKHGGTVHRSGTVMLGDQLVRIDGLDCFGRVRDDINRRVFGTPTPILSLGSSVTFRIHMR